jgi:hypothetical protein
MLYRFFDSIRPAGGDLTAPKQTTIEECSMLRKRRSTKPHRKAKALRRAHLEQMHQRILRMGRSPPRTDTAHLCEVVNMFYELAKMSGLVKRI